MSLAPNEIPLVSLELSQLILPSNSVNLSRIHFTESDDNEERRGSQTSGIIEVKKKLSGNVLSLLSSAQAHSHTYTHRDAYNKFSFSSSSQARLMS